MTLDKRSNTSNAFGKSIKRVMLKIRDTAGQEEMVSLLDRHLEGQDAGTYFDNSKIIKMIWVAKTLFNPFFSV